MSESPEANKNEPVEGAPEPEQDVATTAAAETAETAPPKEVGGRDGPEPVRYGDWEKNGRCIDF
ncbi:DUF1674 domain-containing protein [Wenzhouxiangella sp. XN24]|uniref:DUF1674 domain-containing protein n=1 Tax=Wenzhouxiangella sp. XN24 TaxID=2713569 RepID=UPI0013ECE9D3|nr:DUF1674 domain-containing protein [Wenzhouxiangella sp. XN24]NGX16758.1 DUF1674 domain-containing protein [Wenzhouxiangella sp. XN24]